MQLHPFLGLKFDHHDWQGFPTTDFVGQVGCFWFLRIASRPSRQFVCPFWIMGPMEKPWLLGRFLGCSWSHLVISNKQHVSTYYYIEVDGPLRCCFTWYELRWCVALLYTGTAWPATSDDECYFRVRYQPNIVEHIISIAGGTDPGLLPAEAHRGLILAMWILAKYHNSSRNPD